MCCLTQTYPSTLSSCAQVPTLSRSAPLRHTAGGGWGFVWEGAPEAFTSYILRTIPALRTVLSLWGHQSLRIARWMHPKTRRILAANLSEHCVRSVLKQRRPYTDSGGVRTVLAVATQRGWGLSGPHSQVMESQILVPSESESSLGASGWRRSPGIKASQDSRRLPSPCPMLPSREPHSSKKQKMPETQGKWGW